MATPFLVMRIDCQENTCYADSTYQQLSGEEYLINFTIQDDPLGDTSLEPIYAIKEKDYCQSIFHDEAMSFLKSPDLLRKINKVQATIEMPYLPEFSKLYLIAGCIVSICKKLFPNINLDASTIRIKKNGGLLNQSMHYFTEITQCVPYTPHLDSRVIDSIFEQATDCTLPKARTIIDSACISQGQPLGQFSANGGSNWLSLIQIPTTYLSTTVEKEVPTLVSGLAPVEGTFLDCKTWVIPNSPISNFSSEEN